MHLGGDFVISGSSVSELELRIRIWTTCLGIEMVAMSVAVKKAG